MPLFKLPDEGSKHVDTSSVERAHVRAARRRYLVDPLAVLSIVNRSHTSIVAPVTDLQALQPLQENSESVRAAAFLTERTHDKSQVP
jgi:hypothetical protein